MEKIMLLFGAVFAVLTTIKVLTASSKQESLMFEIIRNIKILYEILFLYTMTIFFLSIYLILVSLDKKHFYENFFILTVLAPVVLIYLPNKISKKTKDPV